MQDSKLSRRRRSHTAPLYMLAGWTAATAVGVSDVRVPVSADAVAAAMHTDCYFAEEFADCIPEAAGSESCFPRSCCFAFAAARYCRIADCKLRQDTGSSDQQEENLQLSESDILETGFAVAASAARCHPLACQTCLAAAAE